MELDPPQRVHPAPGITITVTAAVLERGKVITLHVHINKAVAYAKRLNAIARGSNG